MAWTQFRAPKTELVDVYDIDLGVAVAIGREHNALAIGRPNRSPIVSSVLCEVSLVGAIGSHDIDLRVAVAIGQKRNAVASGRPNRADRKGVV